jgi:hypothetical protein
LQHLKKLGYKVAKVHRAVSFDQSFWLRDYIRYNTIKRQAAKRIGDGLMAAFLKLANNAVYGKCLENVRNYGDFRFAYNQSSAYKLFTDSAYDASNIINENLVGVRLHKKEVRDIKGVIFCAANNYPLYFSPDDRTDPLRNIEP